MIQNFLSKLRFIFRKNNVLSLKRSSHWSLIRDEHLESNPKCAACGGTKNLNVHHIVPVHIDGTKELDLNNLITLCEENHCHYAFGHLYNWSSYNNDVVSDAAKWLNKVKNRPH